MSVVFVKCYQKILFSLEILIPKISLKKLKKLFLLQKISILNKFMIDSRINIVGEMLLQEL